MASKPATVSYILKAKNLARGVRMNPVPPSSRAGMRGPTRDAIEKCADLYERFSGQDAMEVGRIKVPPMPQVAMAIGELDFVGYTTVRDGVIEKYIHRFHKKDRPLLVVDSTGKTLYLVGGNYDFTERGIVDASDN